MQKLKVFSLLTVALLLVLTLSGCIGGQKRVSREMVFNFYDKVQLGQTKDQVDAGLGVVPTESTQLKNVFDYMDGATGFGVSILFNENGLATSKTLLYPNSGDIAFLTKKPVTQEQADKIVDGTSYDEVKKLLGGEGTEINATQIPFEDNKISYIRVWINEDESMLQAVFGTDEKTNNAMFFDH